MLKRGLFACAVLGITTSAFAGARIDLRPVGETVMDNTIIVDQFQVLTVDVFVVDTGNPQGDIGFRGLFLDFTDTSAGLTFPDPDGMGPLAANQYAWVNPFGAGAVFPDLPRTSWVYPSPVPVPILQNTLLDNSELRIGGFVVNAGAMGGLLDVMNDDEPDPNFGARADFGFGGPGDPVTIWRAFTGELTGGSLNVQIVPEPTTLALLGVGAIAALRRRRAA